MSEVDHLNEWMKLQEETNKDLLGLILDLRKRLADTEKALIHLMQFTGLIDNSPPTEEEEEWARKIIAEGRHQPKEQ